MDHVRRNPSNSSRSICASVRKPLLSADSPLPRPQPYPLEWAVEQPDPELDRLREQKAWELKQKKLAAETARKAQVQRLAEAKDMEKAASELRKREFTYDYDGKILLMKQRPLPDVPHVEFSLAGETERQPERQKAASPRPLKAVKQTPIAEFQFVKSVNPTPLIDLLKLNPGVTAIECSRAKHGPESEQKTMSRDDYQRLISENVANPPKSDVSASPHRGFLSSVPDSSRELHCSSSVPTLPPPDLSSVDKFNREIMHSDCWGANIASHPMLLDPIPEKPSVKSLQATHGKRVRRPRERPFVARKVNKERLPPPRMGKTMGHGMVDPDFR